MKAYTHHIESLRIVATGLLLVFAIGIGRELWSSSLHTILGIIAICIAVILAKQTAHHFHAHHHHAGDSVFDAVAVSILFIANMLHPAVDGFSFIETLHREGALAGAILGGSIVLHEILRQSALIVAFRSMGVRWYWVILTALFGIVGGVGAGLYEAKILEQYEIIADLATLFAYSFIIAEFYFAGHGSSKKQWWLLFLGIIVGLLVSVVTSMH